MCKAFLFVLGVVVVGRFYVFSHGFAADGCARYAIDSGVILELNVLELGQHISFYAVKESRSLMVG